MKRRIGKALKGKGGEILIESLVSLIVLSILIMGVSQMILASFRISSSSALSAGTMQENTNSIILESSPPTKTDEIIFEVDGIDGVRAAHSIDVSENPGNITSFIPKR